MEPSGRQFKGWTKPGRLLDRDSGSWPVCGPGESLDAISGDFRLFQLEAGHRFSTDDLLAAWYGTQCAPQANRVLDLGSGIGSVGMIAAWRLPGASFVTIEAQDESVRLARKSAIYNGLENRYEIRHGDFRGDGILALNEHFDLILGSPPYFPEDAGIHGDHPQKIACRFELRGTVADYCTVASWHLAPGGMFACVFPVNPAQQLERVKQGARDAGLAILRYRPVCLREGEPPLLGVFAMVKASDFPERMGAAFLSGGEPLWTEPVLVIRTASGGVHPEYQAIKHSIGFPP
jgi:tRNA1Val (adenine37-N6)-methyltransferase